jgi:hypothetical protein
MCDCAPHPIAPLRPEIHPGVTLAIFTHSVQTRANGIIFAHQSLCNPKISTLLKAVRKGFLKGCPNLNSNLILKYLNPSPTTSKGHMKRPHHGIKSTHPKHIPLTELHIPVMPPPVLVPVNMQLPASEHPHVIGARHNFAPTFIINVCNESIANVFCFSTFTNRHSGMVYKDLMGNFPFVSFNGSACFLVLYHYKANAILATVIAGLDDVSIYNAYKEYFDDLAKKGYKPKLNVIDNEATKHIKQLLTSKHCKLQLVEPHNHRVNAAEQLIQTLKDLFISALATTDCNFPLQLWDMLTPQVINTLNMMRVS